MNSTGNVVVFTAGDIVAIVTGMCGIVVTAIGWIFSHRSKKEILERQVGLEKEFKTVYSWKKQYVDEIVNWLIIVKQYNLGISLLQLVTEDEVFVGMKEGFINIPLIKENLKPDEIKYVMDAFEEYKNQLVRKGFGETKELIIRQGFKVEIIAGFVSKELEETIHALFQKILSLSFKTDLYENYLDHIGRKFEIQLKNPGDPTQEEYEEIKELIVKCQEKIKVFLS